MGSNLAPLVHFLDHVSNSSKVTNPLMPAGCVPPFFVFLHTKTENVYVCTKNTTCGVVVEWSKTHHLGWCLTYSGRGFESHRHQLLFLVCGGDVDGVIVHPNDILTLNVFLLNFTHKHIVLCIVYLFDAAF